MVKKQMINNYSSLVIIFLYVLAGCKSHMAFLASRVIMTVICWYGQMSLTKMEGLTLLTGIMKKVLFALGGMNGGDISGTPFPQKFEIDYVRVYQKKN